MFLNIFSYNRKHSTALVTPNSLPNWYFSCRWRSLFFLVFNAHPQSNRILKRKITHKTTSVVLICVLKIITEVEYLFILYFDHFYFFSKFFILVVSCFPTAFPFLSYSLVKALCISGILTFCLWPEMFKIRNHTCLWRTALFKWEMGVSAWVKSYKYIFPKAKPYFC